MAKTGDVWELHGITSWGVACNARDLPGVYAAVHCEYARTYTCTLTYTRLFSSPDPCPPLISSEHVRVKIFRVSHSFHFFPNFSGQELDKAKYWIRMFEGWVNDVKRPFVGRSKSLVSRFRDSYI